MKKKKKLLTANDFCGFHMNETSAFMVKPYLETVLGYKFSEEPDYQYLKFLLQKSLLDENIVPNNKFEWINTL